MKSSYIGAAMVALALGTSASYAHEGMHGPGGKYDKDEDAALSLAEYTVYLKDNKQDVSKAATRFAALDANKDGKLSSAEFLKGMPAEKSK